jgi:hypothetical protein
MHLLKRFPPPTPHDILKCIRQHVLVHQMKPSSTGIAALEYYLRKNFYKTASLMGHSCLSAAILGASGMNDAEGGCVSEGVFINYGPFLLLACYQRSPPFPFPPSLSSTSVLSAFSSVSFSFFLYCCCTHSLSLSQTHTYTKEDTTKSLAALRTCTALMSAKLSNWLMTPWTLKVRHR